MNKVQLTSLVRSIVKRKLNEIGERPKPVMGKPISSINWGGAPKKPQTSKRQYGLVVGEEGGEPMIQVVGYGVSKLSTLKKSVAERLESLAKEAKVGKFNNVSHGLQPDGVLMLFVNALNEIEEQLKGKLKEVDGMGGIQQPTSTNLPKDKTSAEQGPQMSDADSRALADANQDKEKLSNDISRIKGAIAKLQEPVKRKMMEAEKKIADLEKKLGVASKKIEDINKKYN